MKYQIDDIDRKILSYLVKNARVPFLEIARECGISGAAIHQRVKKMEDAGIIEGSRFIVKPRALGFKICAFIGVILDNASQYKSCQRNRKDPRSNRMPFHHRSLLLFPENPV